MGAYQAYTGNGTPNFSALYENTWGSGMAGGYAAWGNWASAATNFVFGINPAYYLDDFLAVYPKFFGPPTAVSGCTVVNGSADIDVPSANGLLMGQFLQCSALPKGTLITAVNGGTITVNNAATSDLANATLQVYEGAPISVYVTQLYINLAVASLVQARWQDIWPLAVAWFVAHYCTLYARSDATEVQTALQTIVHGETPTGAVPGDTYTLSAAPPGGVLQSFTVNGQFQVPGTDYLLSGQTITMATQLPAGAVLWATWLAQQQTVNLAAAPTSGAAIAAQGLAGGIQVSKSVGDVSVSYQVLTSLEGWGHWNLTSYGQLLATNARVIGAGPAVFQ